MIIILKNADFSQSNIGTLSTWRITRSLGAGATYEGPTSVDKGASFTATVTIAEGYELGAAGVTVTMGGATISATTVNGNVITITIASVTGNIVIKVPTVNTSTDEPEVPDTPDEPVIDPKAPIVDLQLLNVTDGVLRNMGTGGSTYDATVQTVSSSDSYTSDATEFTLINHAYAETPYGFKPGDTFTIAIRARWNELNTNQYQRLMRTEQDTPSLFYSYTTGMGVGAKLAGTSSNNFKALDTDITVKNPDTNAPLNTAYLLSTSTIKAENMHTYVWTGDGSKIDYYIDGVLKASQDESALNTSTRIGLGDNDPAKNFYASKASYEMFRIYNYAMTVDEVAALNQN